MNSEISTTPVIKFTSFIKQRVTIELVGHRVVNGLLKYYDKYNNCILDDCVEQTPDEQKVPMGRPLGRLYVRGTMVC